MGSKLPNTIFTQHNVAKGLLSCVIDTREKRDMRLIEITGTFTHDTVYAKMEGSLAELKFDPKLSRKHLSNENGRSFLYMTLKKPPCGNHQEAMLIWRTLTA